MPTFASDERIATLAAAYALDAIDIAEKNFKAKLDGSDDSIAVVESLLGKLHGSLATGPRPPDDVIWTFAKAFGSYVGEVFRKHHGGEWGMVTDGDQTFPGIRWKESVLFWPWGRVHSRLVDGPENNVLHYYRVMSTS